MKSARQALADEGIHIRSGGGRDFKTTCPQCSHTRKPANRKDPCLSVTLDADGVGAVWKCHNSCGFDGNIPGREAQERKGGEWDWAENPTSKPKSQPDVEVESTPPPAIKESPLSEAAMQFFTDRGIQAHTIEAFGITETTKNFGDGEEPAIVFPYFENGEVVNRKYRNLKDGEGKRYMQERNAKQTLYNFDRVLAKWDNNANAVDEDGEAHTRKRYNEVIFVEGEMDVMTLYQLGFGNAVTMPSGASKTSTGGTGKRFLSLANSYRISEVDKVILAGDSDETGQVLMEDLRCRFGADICYDVSWPTHASGMPMKDANQAFLKASREDVVEAVRNAKGMPIDGVVTMASIRKQIHDLYYGRGPKPLPTGFGSLDECYKVYPTTFTVVTGTPGSGKSEFLNALALNLVADHNWKFMVFSPEHSPTRHSARLFKTYAGRPFDDGPTPRMSIEEVDECIDKLTESVKFVQLENETPDINWILGKMKAESIRSGINGVIIDPYNELKSRQSVKQREDEYIRDLISACKQFCHHHKVAMWLVAHPHKMRRDPATGDTPMPNLYDISGAAHWNNMADVGLVVHRPSREEHEDETIISVKKVREQGLYGKPGDTRLHYDRVTGTYRDGGRLFSDGGEMTSRAETTEAHRANMKPRADIDGEDF